MKVLSGPGIAESIGAIEPTHIAVAYLGIDWDSFIPRKADLQSVVISPTVGTNPNAVQSLVNAISWDRVHFLEDLHAKIYLGRASAVVGSANLTKNGLSGVVLAECAVKIEEASAVKDLRALFFSIEARAKVESPDTAAKLLRLQDLRDKWRLAIANGFLRQPVGVDVIDDYILTTNQDFYVVWYVQEAINHSRTASHIERNAPAYELTFHARDEVCTGRFVLAWLKDKEGGASKGKGNVYWMFIHEVLPNGAVDPEHGYTTLVVQRSDRPIPPEPFKLTPTVISRFLSLMNSRRLAKYFLQPDAPYLLEESFDGLPKLIEELKGSPAPIDS